MATGSAGGSRGYLPHTNEGDERKKGTEQGIQEEGAEDEGAKVQEEGGTKQAGVKVYYGMFGR